MARKKKKIVEEEAEVPIAAMIDVVFLLLIYFIVTSKEVVDEAWVAVNLPGPPPPSEVEPPPPPPSVDIFVQSDKYYYQGAGKDLTAIEGTLKGIYAAMGEETIINIKVSMYAKHEMLVLLLDRMNKAKLETFNLHSLKHALSQ